MAQESWKIEKDETDCEILKPPAASASSSSPPPPLFVKSPPEAPAQRSERTDAPTPDSDLEAPSANTPPPKEEAAKPVRFTNRCSSCEKRVGLTGFRCRCGSLFCGRHRYSDTHDCSFDYKAAGREQISKANPLIRAAKIIKI